MSILDILSSAPETITLNDTGNLLWQDAVVANLEKGDTLTTPTVKLSNTDNLDIDQAKQVTKHLNTWVETHIKTVLKPLLDLENIQISGAAKGIAFQLFEKFGVMYRKDINDLIKDLEKEARQFLGKRGVRLGAYYVYQRDMLKPAAVNLRSVLWRIFYGQNDLAITPPAGNVSMTIDKQAPKGFYRMIGFPVFGTTAVRMDMVERVNSGVFDGAVEGKYTFDPALASTIGVGVDALYLVLDDLGFRYDVTEVEVGEGEAKEKKEIRTYHLKKAPIKALRSKRKPHQKSKTATNKPKKEKQPDPDSPFAALQGLLKS